MLRNNMPFLQQLKDLVNNKYHGKIIYVSISGSDLYGFRSTDSDTDFRGCFQIKTNKLLGLESQTETIEFETYKKNGEVESEAVLHELRKEIGLILKGNCNILEHLFAQPMVWTTNEHHELKQIAESHWNQKGIYNSYRGMAYQNYNKFILNGKHTAKKYLYIIRALLAGVYALENNSIEPNIETLNSVYKNEIVSELIDLKKRGLEKEPVPRMDKYDAVCDELFGRIDNVYAKIQRQEEPDTTDVDKWLKEKRLKYLDL